MDLQEPSVYRIRCRLAFACAILVAVDFACVAANLRESFRILAAHRPTGEVREYPGVSIASAGAAFQMFNAAFLSSPVEAEAELERRIVQPALHFRVRGLEWAYWVCEGWYGDDFRGRARQIFRKQRLRLAVELPGMVTEQVAPPSRRLPRLDIRRVCDGPTRDAFCNVGSVCFRVPLAWFREVFTVESVWKDFPAYVGYVDEEPVSTAAIVAAADAAGVYNVATMPGYQRRGYGEAIMRHALERAHQEFGLTRTLLQSTPQGFRLYQRMGYRTVTGIAVYAS